MKISEALQFVHGEMAQHYNLSRGCRQRFWSSAEAIGDSDWLEHTAGRIGMSHFDTAIGAEEDGFGLKTFFLRAKNGFKSS